MSKTQTQTQAPDAKTKTKAPARGRPAEPAQPSGLLRLSLAGENLGPVVPGESFRARVARDLSPESAASEEAFAEHARSMARRAARPVETRPDIMYDEGAEDVADRCSATRNLSGSVSQIYESAALRAAVRMAEEAGAQFTPAQAAELSEACACEDRQTVARILRGVEGAPAGAVRVASARPPVLARVVEQIQPPRPKSTALVTREQAMRTNLAVLYGIAAPSDEDIQLDDRTFINPTDKAWGAHPNARRAPVFIQRTLAERRDESLAQNPSALRGLAGMLVSFAGVERDEAAVGLMIPRTRAIVDDIEREMRDAAEVLGLVCPVTGAPVIFDADGNTLSNVRRIPAPATHMLRKLAHGAAAALPSTRSRADVHAAFEHIPEMAATADVPDADTGVEDAVEAFANRVETSGALLLGMLPERKEPAEKPPQSRKRARTEEAPAEAAPAVDTAQRSITEFTRPRPAPRPQAAGPSGRAPREVPPAKRRPQAVAAS